jgi:CheY-like chemotaxis protein
VQPAGADLAGQGPGLAPAPSLEGIRVLVVDDEADARGMLAEILARRGAGVTTAGSVREALAAAEQAPPDVLVSDLAMPGEDGYALIRRLRALAPAHGGLVPAIALTAHATGEDRARVLAAGYQVHLAKPVDAAVLTAVVARLAASRSGGLREDAG